MRFAAAIALAAAACAALAQEADVDVTVRRACTAAALGDAEGLREARGEIESIDRQWQAAGLGTTGLIDNIATLENVLANRRTPDFTAEQQRIARSAGTGEERRLLRALGDSLPWPTLTRLRWENRYNRAAGGVNWVIRRLEQLITGQIQAFLQMGNDVVFASRGGRMPTSRERKIVALAQRLAAEAPGTAEAHQAQVQAEAIRAKIERNRRRDQVRRIRVAQQQEQWETALALAQGALVLWPNDAEFTRLEREADHAIGERRRAWQRSLEVDGGADAALSTAQAEAAAEAMRMMLRNRSSVARESLAALARESSGSALADDATLLAAVVEEVSGETASARGRLEALAQGTGNTRWIADAMRREPPIDPDRELRDAIARRHQLSRRFVLQGARSVDENLHLASSSALSQGIAAPASLGVFFFIDSLFRGVALAIHNPNGAEAVVDALARVERRQGSLTPEQRAMQRDRLRDLGRFEQALAVNVEIPDASPRVSERLRSQIARGLFDAAKEEDDDATQRRMLEHVIEQYSGTDAACEAEQMLDAAPFPGSRLTADQVRESIRTLRDAGWPLQPTLTDGDRGNGEIESSGVIVASSGTVHYRVRGSESWQEASPEAASAPRLAAAAQALARQSEAVSTLESHDRPHVPLEITGSLGASGVYAVPQLQRFRHVDEDLPLYE